MGWETNLYSEPRSFNLQHTSKNSYTLRNLHELTNGKQDQLS